MHSPLEILEAETREEENTDMETMKILQAVQAGLL
jgi:hypothetical protein